MLLLHISLSLAIGRHICSPVFHIQLNECLDLFRLLFLFFSPLLRNKFFISIFTLVFRINFICLHKNLCMTLNWFYEHKQRREKKKLPLRSNIQHYSHWYIYTLYSVHICIHIYNCERLQYARTRYTYIAKQYHASNAFARFHCMKILNLHPKYYQTKHSESPSLIL